MIPEPIRELLVEIAEKVGGEVDKREAKNDPEKCLTSLLLNINERVQKPNEMLDFTVEYSFYEDTLEEANQFLRRHKSRKVNGKHKSKKALVVVA